MGEEASSTPLPWTRGCFVCGEENPRGLGARVRREGNLVVLDFHARAEHAGWSGIVHGGITTALLDEVMTWAAIVAARKGVVAAELVTRLKLPFAVGEKVRVEAELAPDSRPRVLRTVGRLVALDGREIATATGKYMPVRDGSLTLDADEFIDPPGAPGLREILE